MRRLGLLLFLMLVAPAAAQEPFLGDPEGDHRAYVAGDPQDPLDRYDRVDLRSMTWTEQQEGFLFTLQVTDLSPPPGHNFQDSARYGIAFHHGGIDYLIEIDYFVDVTGEAYEYGYLWETTEENGYLYRSMRASLELEIDEAAGTFSALVPREAITDMDGAPITKGGLLEDFRAVGETTRILNANIGGVTTGSGYYVADHMPDEAPGPSYEALLGMGQSGDAALASQDPYRLSNGGATSLVYDVHAKNAGQRQSFRIEATDVPEGWTVSLPFSRIVLDEGEERNFPILITTQSGHQHGGSRALLLTMTGERDPDDVGRLELGIKYTDIPQPAGHHPKLWIHTENPFGDNPLQDVSTIFGQRYPYMNALEDDPADSGQGAASWTISIIGTESFHSWLVPLNPGLGIGLDFDTTETAQIEVPIEYDYIAQDVVLRGGLYHASSEGRVMIGEIQAGEPASWQQGTHTFEAAMDIHEDADFLPYEHGADLWLELEIQGTLIGMAPLGPGAEPRLAGGWMELPLREYHDRVDKFYQAVEALRFDADFLERPVNPGETLVFQTHLRNAGTADERVHLNLTGINEAWGRVLGDATFDLPAGKERKVAVAVEVPSGSPDGALADLVLQAHSADDPFRRAVIDLIAIVDDETDHPDDAKLVADLSSALRDDRKSPGFEIAAIGLGLLALALLRRR